MKRLLILTVLAMLFGGAAGCRFMECLWRGAPCQQQQTVTPVVTCPPACPPACPDACGASIVAPGPEATYAPATPGR